MDKENILDKETVPNLLKKSELWLKLKNESTKDKTVPLVSIITEAFDRINEGISFSELDRERLLTNYKDTSMDRLKKFCQSVDFDMDNFAVKSKSKKDKIIGYQIPVVVKNLFLSFLLADGRKGGTLNKLNEDKEITTEERLNFMMIMRAEMMFTDTDTSISDRILKAMYKEITDIEELKSEILAGMTDNINSCVEAVTMLHPIKEILTKGMLEPKYGANKNPDIDIDNYENLNPSTVKDYLNKLGLDSYNVLAKYHKELLQIYEDMIDKASKAWLELVVDFAKYTIALVPEPVTDDDEEILVEEMYEKKQAKNKATREIFELLIAKRGYTYKNSSTLSDIFERYKEESNEDT